LVLIMALESPVLFTVKREVLSWPVVGRVIRGMGNLAVDRSSSASRLASYREIAGRLRAGCRVHVFPEGTFTRVAGLRPLRLGTFYMAAETGRPVIPVAIRGTRAALSDERWLVRPARIEVERLTPIVPRPAAGLGEVTRMRDEARLALSHAVHEPLLEIARRTPAARQA
jgi:1-acyl-sn-glycerol-3-phosphate acyltransferase